MTRRPADVPLEVWASSMRGSLERLERNWLRLYCALIPRPYRRQFFWTARWGPVGMVLATWFGVGLRAAPLLSVLLSRWRRRPDSNR